VSECSFPSNMALVLYDSATNDSASDVSPRLQSIIPAGSMHPTDYQSHIATTHIRGSIRLLNTKCSMLKVMKLLEPLAARDRGGVRFTYTI
jgi:hypothetical protein